jgi:RNA polymerase sigma-70 factor (ECF subfamily)
MTAPLDPANASDQELVTMAIAGVEEAKTEIANRYWQPVHTAISHLVHDDDDVEDITQDTFIKVFEQLATVRDESKISAWIFRIANNTALDFIRKEGQVERDQLDAVRPAGSSDPSDPRKLGPRSNPLAGPSLPTPAPADGGGLAPALAEALARLREQDRECYTLYEIEGRSYGYIADFLDLPEGTVASRIHRARKELREELGPLYESLRPGSRPPK